MISSTRSSWTACTAAVYGSGWATWPCASIPSRAGAPARAAGGAPPPGGRPRRVALRRDDQEARRRPLRPLPDPLQQRIADDGLVRDHEHVRRPPSPSRSTTTCSTGRSPAALRMRVDDVRGAASPDFWRGCVETITSSGRLELRERVSDRRHRIGLDDEPVRGDPGLAQPRTCGRAGGRRPRGACPRRRRSPRRAVLTGQMTSLQPALLGALAATPHQASTPPTVSFATTSTCRSGSSDAASSPPASTASGARRSAARAAPRGRRTRTGPRPPGGSRRS